MIFSGGGGGVRVSVFKHTKKTRPRTLLGDPTVGPHIVCQLSLVTPTFTFLVRLVKLKTFLVRSL